MHKGRQWCGRSTHGRAGGARRSRVLVAQLGAMSRAVSQACCRRRPHHAVYLVCVVADLVWQELG